MPGSPSIGARLTGAAGLALLVLCALLTFGDPILPGADLDSSWVLAGEHAVRNGLVFGRNFIFTFGPYQVLATRLFDPDTFGWVLFYDAFAVVAVFWTALCNRSIGALAGLAVCFIVLRVPGDALVPAALFGVFLICLRRQGAWPLLFVALCGPLLLSKLSFAIVLAPLMLLADLDRMTRRRPPFLALLLAASVFAAYVLGGQPPAAFPDFVANSAEIIVGYGRAMQIPGSRPELVSSLAVAAFCALAAALFALLSRGGGDRRGRDLRPVAAVLGFVWLLFSVFKMGFVRQDLHTLLFHCAAPAALAMAFGYFDAPGSRSPRAAAVFWATLLGVAAISFYWRSVAISHYSRDLAVRPVPTVGADLGRDAARVVLRFVPRLETGLGWATGRRFATMAAARRRGEGELARAFPRSVAGTVDAIPWDAGPLIASGLDYSPRPVPQSYSAYTPALQKLEVAHFAGKGAPETLILRVEDVDGRLPTLALGPSLPVIGRRYDAVGRDALGLVLRRRAAPRATRVSLVPFGEASIGAWVAVPQARGRLVMAHVRVERTLAGRAAGFLFREPVMSITLRARNGREATYRFVPDMAGLGVAVSPMPQAWAESAPILLEPALAAAADQTAAFRLTTRGGDWAFRRASIRFELVALAPGFAGPAPPALTRRPAGGGSRTYKLIK